jgi:phosphatidylglycerophosphate synthase
MNRPNTIAAGDIRSDYKRHSKSEQDKNELMGYYVFRPLSFYLTAMFMNRGFTADQTTWVSIVALLIGCLFLVIGTYATTVVGAALLTIWVILDFVDGNIARYEKTSSRYGELIDALGAFLAHLSFFAAGIGFYFSRQEMLLSGSISRVYPVLILILGGIASLSAIWIRLVYHKFNNTFPEAEVGKNEVVTVRDTSSMSALVLHLGHNFVNLSGFLLPYLLITAVLDRIDLFIIPLAFANLSILAITLVRILRLAKKHDASESVNA